MLRSANFLTLLLLMSAAIGFAREVPSGDAPAFSSVPELSAGFDLLYEQKFAEARQIFASWESRNLEDPFGQVAVAATYLFEELYLQGVLTSDFFLNESKFLHGIDGRPSPERMSLSSTRTSASPVAKGGVGISASCNTLFGSPVSRKINAFINASGVFRRRLIPAHSSRLDKALEAKVQQSSII